ncbi:MAG: tetratricopeptide repeat protein [Deltaproteobacteria bacterium]|nr:tetratricopeptide repeat protein [Deltaproteobacteria bacterium]
MLEARGELASALSHCSESLAVLEAADEPDATLRERLRTAIQGLHFELGDYEIALAQAIALRDEAERERGPSHPRTGGMHLNVGRAAQALRQYALAESSALRAAEIFRAAYGEHHRWVVSAWMNLGALRQAQDDAVGAEAAARSALAACGERRDAATARVLHNLAEARRTRGHAAEALVLERVASIESEVLPVDHLQGVRTLHSRGNALLDLGRLDEAARALAEARRVLQRGGTTDLAAIDESLARLERLRAAGR